MSRNKLARFRENALNKNVVEIGKPNFGKLSGKWRSDHFENEQELIVELGCGKGEYTIGLGQVFPEKNYIGVDIKGSRIWVGSKRAIRENMENVAFLRTQIEMIEEHFAKNELDEIWITFPDPRPKDRDEKRRLTAPKFMEVYKSLLKDDGWLKFKTDNTPLFEYTLELIKQGEVKVKNMEYTFDLYESDLMQEHHGVRTKYEQLFFDKGERIKYLKFQFTN
ncbi:MAG: tRNA (guanosine(46)-N7)-methyltransferase TrmB [Reichenbachiella sp.]